MSCMLHFVVETCFHHSTCNSELFVLRIGSKDAYSRGVSCDSLNWSKPVWFCAVVLSWEAQTETGSQIFSSSGLVQSVFSLFAHQIYYNHVHIDTIQLWKFGDEVDTHSMPSIFRDFKRVYFADGFTLLGFCVKTHVTCLTVLANVARHIGPPVIVQN